MDWLQLQNFKNCTGIILHYALYIVKLRVTNSGSCLEIKDCKTHCLLLCFFFLPFIKSMWQISMSILKSLLSFQLIWVNSKTSFSFFKNLIAYCCCLKVVKHKGTMSLLNRKSHFDKFLFFPTPLSHCVSPKSWIWVRMPLKTSLQACVNEKFQMRLWKFVFILSLSYIEK